MASSATNASKKPYYVASGVRADFDKLMENYRETKTVRYESFSQIWRDMKMPMIFYGRRTDANLAEFVFECLHIASEYWLQSTNLQVQTGGLYLVYGLFETQPCDPKVRLMLTVKDWEKVGNFMKEIQEQAHYDVCYVYRKLLMRRAFHYSASSIPVQMILTREMRAECLRKDQPQKSKRSTVSELLDPSNIGQLEALHKQYHVMKCALAGPKSTKPDPSLRVINHDLVEFIKTKIGNFEELKRNPESGVSAWQIRLQKDRKMNDDDDDNDEDYVPPGKKSRGNMRKEIKERAFKAAGPVRRDRRHRKRVRSSEEEPSKSPRKGGRKATSSSERCSEEDEDLYKPFPSTSGVGDAAGAELFPSMPQLSDFQNGDNASEKRKKKQDQTKPAASKKEKVSSPSKMPKVVLSPKKDKKSSTTAGGSGAVQKEQSSSTEKSRPKKKSSVKVEQEDIISEPESVTDEPYNKKGPRKSSALHRGLQGTNTKAPRGRKRSNVKGAKNAEGGAKKTKKS